MRELRALLNLDSAYLSRLLRSLEAQGMVTVVQPAGDARVRRATLTQAGRAEFASYDSLSNEVAASILTPLEEGQRARLVAAMREVRRLLAAASLEIAAVPPYDRDARACLHSYFNELQARFDQGFDQTLGKALSDAEMTPPQGHFLLARSDGAPVGCAALVRLDAHTAEIKRMWTAPAARGQGVARSLLEALECTARQAGYARIVLDTNRTLFEAQALYRSQGFVETARYNDNPYADLWFAKELTSR